MFLIFVFHAKRKETETERDIKTTESNKLVNVTVFCHEIIKTLFILHFFSLLCRRHTSFICIILSRHESHTYLYMKPKSPKWKKKTTDSISNYITVHFTIRYSWIGNNIFFICIASRRIHKLVLIKRIIELSRTLIPNMCVPVFGIWIGKALLWIRLERVGSHFEFFFVSLKKWE